MIAVGEVVDAVGAVTSRSNVIVSVVELSNVSATVTVHAGEPMPSGQLDILVQPVIAFGIP